MGKNPLAREAIHQSMRLVSRNVSYRTIGAVDVALWDIAGKAAVQYLQQLLPPQPVLLVAGRAMRTPRTAPGPGFLSLLWFAGVFEFLGGLLVLLGLFTRPVALLLSGEMAIGYFMVHAPKSFFPVLNGGDAAGLYSFIFLYLAFAGPGPWGLDALWRRSSVAPVVGPSQPTR